MVALGIGREDDMGEGRGPRNRVGIENLESPGLWRQTVTFAMGLLHLIW